MSVLPSGILPAVITPFDENGRFACAPFERLLNRLYAADVDGVYVCGQTGEGLLQPLEMRERVAEAAIRCSPTGKAVVIHVGAATTSDAIRLARHAAANGAAAVSSLPPAGPYPFAEIREYYRQLAASVEIPLFVYFFPEIAPGVSTTEQILELCSLPNVAGLKFTDFDLFKLSQIKAQGSIVFNGRDQVLVAGLLMGADGGIGSLYNLIPELFVQVHRLAAGQEWTEARRVQERINQLIAITAQFPLLPAIKTILKWSGIGVGQCIAPRQPLTSEEELRLRSLLEGGLHWEGLLHGASAG